MKHSQRGTPLLGLVLLLSLCAAPAAHAQFAFTKIADTNTLLPGGSGVFAFFGFNPALSGGNVAFYGGDGGTQQGIYLYSHGVLGVVADTTTSIPNGGGSSFTSFDDPSLSGSTVAFYGSDTSTHVGIYTGQGGSLQAVADTTAPIPGGGARRRTRWIGRDDRHQMIHG